MYLRRSFFTIIFTLVLALAYAAPIDEAKRLYDKGQYSEAVTRLKTILKSSPRNATANYYLGMSYYQLGEKGKAINALKLAEDKGSRSAALELARIAYDDYEFTDAAAHLTTLEKLAKKDRKEMPAEADALRAQIIKAKNMIQRVEKIQVVDSIVVPKEEFFIHYKLTDAAGKLLPGSVLENKYAALSPQVVSQPQSAREVFWGMPDENDNINIVSAQILDDGSFEEPHFIGPELGEGGDADYMYMMTDGTTFYFANNGDNSLGGYDIFMSRRAADGSVLEPQNIGMPYNSTYDDYMLVIDEDAGLGWWATDRNQIPDSVTIYVFIPNETRVNYDPDDDLIREYALLTDISLTQDEDIDVESLFDNVKLHSASKDSKEELSHYRNPQARQAMEQYQSRTRDLEIMQAKLRLLRRRYAEGDQSVSGDILSLEKRILAARPILKKLHNQAIQWERGDM